MELEDIRAHVPTQVTSKLLSDEKVYFYGAGSGCLGGAKSYIVVTDSRVLGSAIIPGGCFGGKNVSTVDIPLEHISSTRTGTTGGCLGLFASQTVDVSSGTATSTFSTNDAQRAASIIQQVLRDAKRR